MKKSLLFLLIILSANISLIYSQPQGTISFVGGYDLPLPDLKGDITKSGDNFKTYTMETGLGFGAIFRYYFGNQRRFETVFSAGYQMFSTSKDTIAVQGAVGTFTAKDFVNKMNAISLGAGIQYSIIPAGKVNPFIGAEFTGHFFNGYYEYTSSDGRVETNDLRPASRFGVALGLGADISFSKYIGIVFGGKYHIANLIGKDSTGISSGKYGLDDQKYTDVLGNSVSARNISYFQSYVGISFYFNLPKKSKK